MKESFSTHISPCSSIYPEHSAQSPQPTWVLYTLTVLLGENLDDYLSRPAAYTGPLHPNGTPQETS